MKKVSFSVYPEEYDMLMKSIHESGYKKTEFLLGCVAAAKKNSMEATCRRYAIEHKEIIRMLENPKLPFIRKFANRAPGSPNTFCTSVLFAIRSSELIDKTDWSLFPVNRKLT